MAKRLELFYWDSTLSGWANANYRYWAPALSPDDWQSAVAAAGGYNINPITAVHITDANGFPRRAKVTVISRPRQIGSTTANEGKGRFNNVFTDFQNVRLKDPATGVILLAGKIYDIDEKFDFRYGTSIELDIRDSMEELQGVKTGGWPDKAITGNSTTRSAMIDDILAGNLDYVNSSIIATGGQNKQTTSLRKQESNGKLEFKGNKTALNEIASLAAEEPHSTETREGFQIALAAEALDATETVLDVDNLQLGYANAAAALSGGDHIAVDAEIMKVVSVSTNAITIVRGVKGTTPATHADNASVYRNPGASKFGFDYHVDPAVTISSFSAAAPAQHWNYYQRGMRPESPATYGMTVKYPASSSFTADGFNKLMQNDFAFNSPNNEMYTDVILEYTERGSQVKADGSVDTGVAGKTSTPKRRKFERLNITGAAGQLFVEGMVKLGVVNGTGLANEDAAPEFLIDPATGDAKKGATNSSFFLNNGDYIKVENEIMKVTARETSGALYATVSRGHFGTLAASHANGTVIYRNPLGDPDDWGGKPFGQTEILNSAGGGGFGRIEYQSHTSGSGLENEDPPGFIIVSPFSSAGDTDDMRFNTHMPDSGLAVTGSTSGNSVTTHANCRLANTVGLRKTKVIKNSTSSDPASLRRQVVSFLSRDGQTGTKRGEFKVSGYPYTYIDAAAAKVSRSTNTITFASAAFADNNSGTTNDPRPFGVLVGDVICEMDATATTMTRFAYISSVTATTVVYGTNQTHTIEADGTYAGTPLDASKPMRIYVPLRAGHVIRAVNSLVQVDKDHLVTELTYDEGNGVTMTSISTIGQNDSAAIFRPNILKAVNSNATKYGTDPSEAVVNFSDANRAWKLQGKLTSTDTDTVAWANSAGGEFSLTSTDGAYVYSIAAANTGNMTGSASNEYVLYFAPESDDDAFAVQAAEDYIEDKSRLKIATLTVSTVTDGMANRSLEQNISVVGGGDPGILADPSNILAPGVITVSDGTYSAPSVTFAGSAGRDTGVYYYESGGIEYVAITANGSNAAYFGQNGYNITFNENLWVYGHQYPGATNTYDLGWNDGGGGTDYDYRNIYSVNALSVSSDRRLKEDIQPTNLGLSFLNDLSPVSYKWKEKHDGVMDQRHYGLIAQDVVEILKVHGIDSLEDFGGILHSGNPEQMYKAKYEHFIPILIKAVQELSDEVKELKEKN